MKHLIMHLQSTVPTDSTVIPYWMIYVAIMVPVAIIIYTIVVQRKP